MIVGDVKWGLIGCGNVTEVKSGPPLQMTPHSSLVAVMRRDSKLAEDYARRHHVPKWYSNADELINDPEVNAVYVATPPYAHRDYAIKAMLAGKPVYVEKPMGRTYAECLEMLKVSEETGMPIYIAYYRRALPGFLKVKELVECDAVGSVRMVNVRFYRPMKDDLQGNIVPWRLRPEIAGGGLLFDLAAHTLDYLDYVFGSIGNIKANAFNQASRYPAEDLVLANWQHECGIAGTGAWCFTTSEKNILDEVEIIGDQGKIIFSTFEFNPIVLENNQGRQEFPFERPPHVQSFLMAKIISSLRGQGESPSTGKSAARTNRVLDEMVKTYYRKD
ncbi:MAG: Gfo/Idh/MocA family oxidoreductase [Bacteroidia bacterium]|nr:Gfo/Idh/MocA family oxidoreductase [Bacteroidia bacterium]